MKIDTFNVNLSSTRAFSMKNQVSVETQIKFTQLLDQGMSRFKNVLPDQPMDGQMKSDWFATASYGGQTAVELSQQFLDELEKMRQILDAISRQLNTSGLRGYRMHLAGLERVHIKPYPRPATGMLEFEYMEKKTCTHFEKEATNFFADGVVNTVDGKSIDFSFQMDLERDFFRKDQFVYQEKGYVLTDPLVIHLDTTPPKFSEALASFDLNMDGIDEQIPTLLPGSGFLSFDRNKDGIINDGSELFGPSTNDGFGELSKYDLDKNFWIDENDPVFDELTIWENDDQGDMHLTKIKEAGIGAIYLASAHTPFDLKDADNQFQARIKKTGIALNEDGSVSSIQEIDWAV